MNRQVLLTLSLLSIAGLKAPSTAAAAEATADTLTHAQLAPVPNTDSTAVEATVAALDSLTLIGHGVLKFDPMTNTKKWAEAVGLPKPDAWDNQMDAMMLIDYMTSVAIQKAMSYVAPRPRENLQAWHSGRTFKDFAQRVGFEDPNSCTVWQVLQVALGLTGDAKKDEIVFHPFVAGTDGQCPYKTKTAAN